MTTSLCPVLLTPYTCLSQKDTPCTLLHWVDGELRDAAKGTIIQPSSRDFHTNPMACDMLRVKYDMVLPGYENLEPPSQPQGWDEEEPAVL